MPDGLRAEMTPELAYVGWALLMNAGSAWWVLHYTGWITGVPFYLGLEAYNTGPLGWFREKIRSAIRQFLVAEMRTGMGADGYTDWDRLLKVIYRAQWDDLPVNKHEGSHGRRTGDSYWGSRPRGVHIMCMGT